MSKYLRFFAVAYLFILEIFSSSTAAEIIFTDAEISFVQPSSTAPAQLILGEHGGMRRVLKLPAG